MSEIDQFTRKRKEKLAKIDMSTWENCQSCGHIYDKLQIELFRGVLIGYIEGSSITHCVLCAPKTKYGSSIELSKKAMK